MDMVDRPNQHFHLSGEQLVLSNILNADRNGESDSDELSDLLNYLESTTIYPDIDPSAQSVFAPLTKTNSVNATVPPKHGSANLHSSTDAEDSKRDTLESASNEDPVTHESSASENTDGTWRKPTRFELGARSKFSPKKYVPSPLSQPPMIADAGENEPVRPKTPVRSTLRQNTVSDEAKQRHEFSEGPFSLDATSRSEKAHNDPVEQHQESVKSHPKIAETEEVYTSMDVIEGNVISYTVPFGDHAPPGARSYGKAASKFVRGLFRKGDSEEKSTGDPPLPPPVPGEPKQPSDTPEQSRKRRASSTSSQSSKRSRPSSDTSTVRVSGRRLPLLFTLTRCTGGVTEHRHVVIPLPISWSKFLHMAVAAFAREPCGQEIPTEVSDHAKYVMKWNKPMNHAHGDIFPTETELCRANINAVLQWMLYSGSYDFCEIQDTQTAESVVNEEADSAISETKAREREFDGDMEVNTTTGLGSKGSHETACNISNSGRECEDQGLKDLEPIGKEAIARTAELARKSKQKGKNNADAGGRESVGIKGNSTTVTGVNVDRKGG
ncbi:MAG: hypothetical protein Q9195_004582 [Heterodermia aff. obscurata]